MTHKENRRHCALQAKYLAAAIKRIDGLDVFDPSRSRDVAEARHVAMYVLHNRGFGPTIIGRAFDRDHTTVLYGVGKVKRSKNLLRLAAEYAAAA